jgi:hypothetical protein
MLKKGDVVMAIKIYIDQGHNPRSPNTGAEGNGYAEQDITYEVGRSLATLLRNNGNFDVRLSRPSADTQLGTSNASSLRARVDDANSWGADYFISIHTNASCSSSASGSEALVYSTPSISTNLGEDILDGLNGYLLRSLPEDLNLEMDAWYLDEACTVKFDPNSITDLWKYEEITDLYVKSISFNPNYAWVITDHQIQEQYSKPYQITKMFDFSGRGFSGSEPFHLISEPYTLPTADKVLVDGVETTAESLTLEGGKTYVVTCIEYAKDGDFWLFA